MSGIAPIPAHGCRRSICYRMQPVSARWTVGTDRRRPIAIVAWRQNPTSPTCRSFARRAAPCATGDRSALRGGWRRYRRWPPNGPRALPHHALPRPAKARGQARSGAKGVRRQSRSRAGYPAGGGHIAARRTDAEFLSCRLRSRKAAWPLPECRKYAIYRCAKRRRTGRTVPASALGGTR